MGVATELPRRILVALEPTVLEGAFSALLGHGERSEVVQFHEATPEELSVHYDVAIVTTGLADEVSPDVLITLPDTEAGGDVTIVTVNGLPRRVTTRSNQQVIDLLAEQFPEELHRSA